MKKIFFILLLQIGMLASAYAQSLPKGMNYQAVARNTRGEIIPNQKISLKIYLFGSVDQKRINHYTEIHQINTNDNGLFDLIIGEGSKVQGEYGLIPWNTENIWMEVAMKEKNQSDFAYVTSSKLLAVPYAIHAGAASRLTAARDIQTNQSGANQAGMVANTWSVLGNANSDMSGNLYHINALGTTDKVDLILITDNVERMRILNGGNIVTKLNFEIGQNLKVGENLNVAIDAEIGDSLTVKKSVFLNTVHGNTFNFGPFTVGEKSPTLLSGILTVDLATDLNSTLTANGPTDLNDSLTVNNMSPTKLTGTLQVDSTTKLHGRLSVNNISPTVLTGTLSVDSTARFYEKVKVVSVYQTDTSGLFPSGSLQVGGGAYISKNLYIGGIAKFGGPVAFGGAVTIQDQTQSTNISTGALVVSGGVGIGLNLNVGGTAMIGGMTTVSDLTESTDTLTGALKVFGGVGIRKRINVGGDVSFANNLNVVGISTLADSLSVTSGESYIAHFRNLSFGNRNNGIQIEIDNFAKPGPGWENNFVEFRNSTGGVVGRIEGENVNQYKLNPAYEREMDKLFGGIVRSSIASAIAAVTLTLAIVALVGAATSAAVCVGFGVCVAAPVISFIVKASLDVISAGIDLGAQAVGIALAVDRRNDFIAYKDARYGVTYESGAGDYAEWLPKSNIEETFLPGYIVGVEGGKISKNTQGAKRLMVISSKPIVLGNMQENKEMPYEKVAFLGQVPVQLLGKVNIGDYIIPSGNNDGLGIAINPAKMQVEDYAKIVGVAWTASKNEKHNLINVAIGLNGTDINKVVLAQKAKIQALNDKYDQRNLVLAKLIPGYKDAAAMQGIQMPVDAFSKANAQAISDLKTIASNPSALDYFELTNAQLLELLTKAEKSISPDGSNVELNAFWSRLKTDASFRDEYINELKRDIKKELPKQLDLLNKKGNGK